MKRLIMKYHYLRVTAINVMCKLSERMEARAANIRERNEDIRKFRKAVSSHNYWLDHHNQAVEAYSRLQSETISNYELMHRRYMSTMDTLRSVAQAHHELEDEVKRLRTEIKYIKLGDPHEKDNLDFTHIGSVDLRELRDDDDTGGGPA